MVAHKKSPGFAGLDSLFVRKRIDHPVNTPMATTATARILVIKIINVFKTKNPDPLDLGFEILLFRINYAKPCTGF